MNYNDQSTYTMMTPNGNTNNNNHNNLASNLIIFNDPDAISRELFSYLLTDPHHSSSPSPSSQDVSMSNGGMMHGMNFSAMNQSLLYNNLSNNQMLNNFPNPGNSDPRYLNYSQPTNLSYDIPANNSLNQPPSKTKEVKSSPDESSDLVPKKRQRRKHEEITRNYNCIFPDCAKSYGTLSNLNHHITMQKHGPKRNATEFE